MREKTITRRQLFGAAGGVAAGAVAATALSSCSGAAADMTRTTPQTPDPAQAKEAAY